MKIKLPALTPEQFRHLQVHGWVQTVDHPKHPNRKRFSHGQLSAVRRKAGKKRSANPKSRFTVSYKGKP